MKQAGTNSARNLAARLPLPGRSRDGSGVEPGIHVERRLRRHNRRPLASVVFPTDGKYLGDWTVDEAIAQNGRGLHSSVPVGSVNGGNCYACHQMTKAEISFGNIGPSLYNYGKLRGRSEAIIKFIWTKLYNAQAHHACSNMPRFGQTGILLRIS